MKSFILENTWLQGCVTGWGNGYVLIPTKHPFHGKHYDELNKSAQVHGGLTFSNLIDEDSLGWADGNITSDDIGKWCIGFDTCHYNDSLSNWSKEDVQKEFRFFIGTGCCVCGITF